MSKNVPLQWFNLDFNPGDTLSSVTEQLKSKKRLDLTQLPNSVYVIRLAGNFAIDYKNGVSPTIYIGQGKFRGRLNAHRKWLAKLHGLVAETPLQVKFCMPRSAEGAPINRDLEAFLLKSFEAKFGERPLQNKQSGKLSDSYSFPQGKIGHVLGTGAGKSYAWAIRPLRANPYFKPGDNA